MRKNRENRHSDSPSLPDELDKSVFYSCAEHAYLHSLYAGDVRYGYPNCRYALTNDNYPNVEDVGPFIFIEFL